MVHRRGEKIREDTKIEEHIDFTRSLSVIHSGLTDEKERVLFKDLIEAKQGFRKSLKRYKR